MCNRKRRSRDVLPSEVDTMEEQQKDWRTKALILQPAEFILCTEFSFLPTMNI
jgi:hypothetical protein